LEMSPPHYGNAAEIMFASPGVSRLSSARSPDLTRLKIVVRSYT
jgi:hypothetical protein